LGEGQTYPRLLVLDDVLLSLDLDHRRPLIDTLKKHFAKWQVLLLTHNRAWYDIAKQRLSNRDWQQIELFAVTVGDYESPVVVEDEDHLYRALRYLEPNVAAGEPLDIKAAAVHVRTKFELILKAACERLAVKVPFQRDSKRLTLNALWGSLAAHEETLQGPPTIGTKRDGSKYVQPGKRQHGLVVPKHLAQRVSFSLSWVLNPLSHSESVEQYRAEIFDAIFALDELQRVTTAAAWHRLTEIEDSKRRFIYVLRQREQVLAARQPTSSLPKSLKI
jgi:hypothetical protein